MLEQTFDIILVNDPNISLKLLQFPNCVEDRLEENVSFKSLPNFKELKMDIHIDAGSSKNYDNVKGETFAKNLGNETSKYLDKRCFSSQEINCGNIDNYIGFFDSKKFYLIPLDHILQMKPDFEYISGESHKDISANNSNASPNFVNEEIDKAELVNVRFTNMNIKGFANKKAVEDALANEGSNGEITKHSFKSLDYLERLKKEKIMTDIKFVSKNDENYKNLIGNNLNSLLSSLNNEKDDSLGKSKEVIHSSIIDIKNNNQHGHDILNSDWKTSIFNILKKAEVLTFSQLFKYTKQHLFNNSYNKHDRKGEIFVMETLISHLASIAELILGNWVIKSEYIFSPLNEACDGDKYENDIKPNISLLNKQQMKSVIGHKNHRCQWKSHDILRLCRDFILALYQLSSGAKEPLVIAIDKIAALTHTHPDDIKGILSSIAKKTHNPPIGWRFKFPEDINFLCQSLGREDLQKIRTNWQHKKLQIYKDLNDNQHKSHVKVINNNFEKSFVFNSLRAKFNIMAAEGPINLNISTHCDASILYGPVKSYDITPKPADSSSPIQIDSDEPCEKRNISMLNIKAEPIDLTDQPTSSLLDHAKRLSPRKKARYKIKYA